MKFTKFKLNIGLTVLFLLILIPGVSAQQGGNQSQGHQSPQDGTKNYTLDNSNQFELSVTSNVSYDITFDESVSNRMFGLAINSTNEIGFNFSAGSDFHTMPPKFMHRYNGDAPGTSSLETDDSSWIPLSASQMGRDDETEVEFTYNTFYTLDVSGEFENITFYTDIDRNLGFPKGLSGDYSWIVYIEDDSEWFLLDSDLEEEILTATLQSEELEGDSFTLSIVDFNVETPSEDLETWAIILISVGGVVVIAFGLLMSKQEYRSYLMNRFIDLETGAHRLTMKQVLENQNRESIINAIIDNPGIHFNEILREVEISAGNLAWHLDILVSYKVIRKQRIGQYLIYYPYLDKNPISKIDMSFRKSKTTLDILQLIDDNPGIYQNQIAKRMDLNHKTVKYHIDKLLEAEAISAKQQGRKKLFFPIPPLDTEE